MLDTRLKSNYRIFLSLVIALIVGFSVLFTLGYKSLDRMSREYQSNPKNQKQLEQKQAQELTLILINATMALTKQLREQEAGKLLTDVEAYIQSTVREEELKQNEEEYLMYLDVADNFSVRSSGWNQSYHKYRNYFSYEVISTVTDEVLLRAKGLDVLETETLSKLVLSYDSIGKMSLKELEVNGNLDKETEEALKRRLDAYREFNPLKDYMVHLLEEETEQKREFELYFKVPTDVEFVYYFDTTQMFGVNSVIYTRNISYFYNYIIFALIAVVVLGIALSFFKDYTDKFDRTNIPVEIIFLMAITGAVFVFAGIHTMHDLILATINGNAVDFLSRIGVFKILSETLIALFNILLWSLLLGSVLWLILSFMAVFHLGPKRYFIERSLLGICLTKLKEIYRFFIKTDIQINWKDSAFRQFGKLIALNFLILFLMNLFHLNNVFGLLIYSLFVLAISANYYNRKKKHFEKIIDWMDTLARGELIFEEKSVVEGNPKKKRYVNEDLGEFEPFDERLRQINDGFIKAVDKERESQKSKSELITNMSHDLKTPLTAIIMYINLLKDEQITAEERRKYIEILDAKSMRFKALIDDLFEMSLASTGKLTLERADVDIVGLLKGLRLEYNEKLEEAGIDFRWKLPNDKCILSLDAKKTYRIFENLLVNITKYALKGSRAYIEFSKETEYVDITLTNISDIEITSNPERLLERFARADTSRNTQGSGLGLAIAKNLTEAQDGELSIDVQSDVFKINVRFFRSAA